MTPFEHALLGKLTSIEDALLLLVAALNPTQEATGDDNGSQDPTPGPVNDLSGATATPAEGGSAEAGGE